MEKNEEPFMSLVTQKSIRSFMPEWDELTEEEQAVCRGEMAKVMAERANLGMSVLAIGESLAKIHTVLAPKRLFFRFCEGLNCARSTVHNYLNNYQRVKQYLSSETGLRTAMAMGLKIIGDSDDRPLGVYTDAVKRLPPPPRSENPKHWKIWWDEAEDVRRRLAARNLRTIQEIDQDPEELARSAYRFVVSRMIKCRDARHKRQFLERVVGCALHDLKGVSQMTFFVEAPPEGFRAVLGRPRNPEREEEAA